MRPENTRILNKDEILEEIHNLLETDSEGSDRAAYDQVVNEIVTTMELNYSHGRVNTAHRVYRAVEYLESLVEDEESPLEGCREEGYYLEEQ